MDTPTTAPEATTSTRCAYRSDLGLGCARREHGPEAAHWLTSQPEAAHRDLLRNGFWSRSIPADGPVRS